MDNESDGGSSMVRGSVAPSAVSAQPSLRTLDAAEPVVQEPWRQELCAPRFDLDAAFEQVRLRSTIPLERIYRPHIMVAVHSQLLPRRYTNLAEREKLIDGVWWKLEVTWALKPHDLAVTPSWESECRYMRKLHWLLKLRGRSEYPGFWRLTDHGWESPESLVYALVGEPLGEKLGRHLVEYCAKKKDTKHTSQYRMLLAARCVDSVLVSLERLHGEYGMVVANIAHVHFCVRPGLKTGYLDHTNVQQAGMIEITETSGHPYYPKSPRPQSLTLAMTYAAVLVAFAYFVNPELWEA